jgi:hypothetical protein
VLALAAEVDESSEVEQLEMMAYSGLLGMQEAAERGDIHFALLSKSQDKTKPGLVGEKLEDLHELAQ